MNCIDDAFTCYEVTEGCIWAEKNTHSPRNLKKCVQYAQTHTSTPSISYTHIHTHHGALKWKIPLIKLIKNWATTLHGYGVLISECQCRSWETSGWSNFDVALAIIKNNWIPPSISYSSPKLQAYSEWASILTHCASPPSKLGALKRCHELHLSKFLGASFEAWLSFRTPLFTSGQQANYHGWNLQAVEKAPGILSWPFRRLWQLVCSQYNISQFSSDDGDTKRTARIHQVLSPDCVMHNVFLIAYGKVCMICMIFSRFLSFPLPESICHSVSVVDRCGWGFRTGASHFSLPVLWNGKMAVLKMAAFVTPWDMTLFL